MGLERIGHLCCHHQHTEFLSCHEDGSVVIMWSKFETVQNPSAEEDREMKSELLTKLVNGP